MESNSYTWIKTHKDLVKFLLQNENNQQRLLQELIKAGVNVKEDEDYPNKKIPLKEIDPFSFFVYIYIRNSENSLKTLQNIAKNLNISIPSDIKGVPLFNAQNVWFFPYKYSRKKDDIPTLWKLFKEINQNNVSEKAFSKALEVKYTGKVKLSQVMFMINPEKYLCIDAKTKPFLKRVLSLNLEYNTYSEYMDLLSQIKGKVGGNPFYEISYEAFVSAPKKEKKKDSLSINYWIFKCNPERYDLIGALRDNSKITYQVNQHKKDIKMGDKVILWIGKENAGAYASAKVISEVKEINGYDWENKFDLDNTFNKITDKVELQVISNFSDSPVYLKDITDKEQFSRFKNIQQTNIMISEKEYNALSKTNADEILQDYQDDYSSNHKTFYLNQILYGPPGTGKTYHSKSKAIEIITGENIKDRKMLLELYKHFFEQEQIQFITFHQSYGYEEFVEGIKPELNKDSNKELLYQIKAGIFKQMCKKAEKEISKRFVLIIDEINRGNISKIFGELITLIEVDKRIGSDEVVKTCLPYSNEDFGVPSNLYIIGTMNTADRSIALMDNALRRRFQFVEMMPKPELLDDIVVSRDEVDIKINRLLKKINERIEFLYDRDHTIGHSFFMKLKDIDDEAKYSELCSIFANNIIPLLQEYFYDDWEKIQIVLGDHIKQFKQDPKLNSWDEIKLDQSYRFIQSFNDLGGNSKTLEMQVIGFDHEDIDDAKVCYLVNNLENINPLTFEKIYNSEAYSTIANKIKTIPHSETDDAQQPENDG